MRLLRLLPAVRQHASSTYVHVCEKNVRHMSEAFIFSLKNDTLVLVLTCWSDIVCKYGYDDIDEERIKKFKSFTSIEDYLFLYYLHRV
jgi:hypothetical protein